MDVERGPREPVGCSICPREHDGAANLFPVLVQRQLLIKDRRVGHDLILAIMMDDLLAADIFDNGAVARRIGHRQMERGQPCLSGHCIGNDGERLAAKRVDRLLDGREVVENILRPRRDGESRLGSIEGGILRFGQPKKVSAQSRLVQPVRCRYIKAGSDYASVFGSPSQ